MLRRAAAAAIAAGGNRRRHLAGVIKSAPYSAYITIPKPPKKKKSTWLPRKQQRVRDHSFDGVMEVQKKVRRFLSLRSLLLFSGSSTSPAASAGGVPFTRLAALSRRHLKLPPLEAGRSLLRMPHAFHLSLHPVRRTLHARLSLGAAQQHALELSAVANYIPNAVAALRKLLLMTNPKFRIRLEHIRLFHRDLGLPEDFDQSVVLAYPQFFRLITSPDDDSMRSKYVELIRREDECGLTVPAVHASREQHYRFGGKGGEEDSRFAFPVKFPPGFKIGKYFRIAMWKWQRLPYWSPYEDVSGYDLRSLEAQRRMEKRCVGTIHELLSLTVEKRASMERIAQFRQAMGLPNKLKEFLLMHQGIFYVSTRGNGGKLHTVFLREAYYKGELVNPNEVYLARRKLEELLLMSPKTANLDRMLTSIGGGWDELGGRNGGAKLKEEMLRGGGAIDRDDEESGSDSGVDSLCTE